MIATVTPRVTEVLPQQYTLHVGDPDPDVVAEAPAVPMPPYHTPAGQVTQAEFDALEARVTALETP